MLFFICEGARGDPSSLTLTRFSRNLIGPFSLQFHLLFDLRFYRLINVLIVFGEFD